MTAGPDDPHLTAARVALAGRRLDEAARELALHLEARPNDVEAAIALGLVELLRGDRARFAASHEALAARLESCPPAEPGGWQSLWERSRALAQSTARAAAILALAGLPVPAGLAGCAQPSAPAEHRADAAAEAAEAGAPRPAPTTTEASARGDAAIAPDAPPLPPGAPASDAAPAAADAAPLPPGALLPDEAPAASDAPPPVAQGDGPAGAAATAPRPPAPAGAARPGPAGGQPAGVATTGAQGDAGGAEGPAATTRPRPRPFPMTRYVVARPIPIPTTSGPGEPNDPDDR